MFLSEGIHDGVEMRAYVADEISPEPSISKGVVKTLTERSPLHAMREHPRLGKRPSDATARGDIGSALHAMLFGGAKVQFVGEVEKRSGKEKGQKFIAEDWKTADAQEQRDAIRAAGAIPMLQKDAPLLDAVANAVRLFVDVELGIDLEKGRKEQTILWVDSHGDRSAWCRGRADWLSDDYLIDLDLKTTDAENGAEQGSWIRSTMKPSYYDVQLQMRRRGLGKVLGQDVNRQSYCVVAELSAPFACSLVGVGGTLEMLADRKINRAISLWRRGLDTGVWPAYRGAVYAEATQWEEMAFEAKAAVL